ncbi:GNAT family N-acetyltransferase [Roseibium marinum]|uniref:Putative acetyltransferase n=1 Tax=Roseibium marinum TaxID=281252 RepID=A0A2S3ULQ4_9HYPH|nr:GNAT family N-acetyltransferase [Roseibium marinum]POF28652.1 putative acetyltransferase [Roseibium marinum]
MSTSCHATIAVESPLSEDMRAMIGELNAILRSLTPEEANYAMNAEDMAGPETSVFVARIEGQAAACGALHRHEDGIGELKRFYARPQFRGLGLAHRILDHVTELAAREGLTDLVLETGHNYEAARRLYEQAGFTECGPVLDYPENPYSVFYTRPLRAA